MPERRPPLRRVPLAALVASTLFIFLGVVWTISQQIEPMDFADSVGGQVSELAPVPPGANFVDRSGENVFRLENPGVSDETLPLFGGKASIQGRVVLPDGGAVRDTAVVELVRWVGDRFNAVRVDTNENGEFKLEDVFGGRWSARGWLPGEFASRGAVAVFVASEEDRDITVELGDPPSSTYRITVSPERLTFATATVTLNFVNLSIDENGRLVESFPAGGYFIEVPDGYSAPGLAGLEEGRSVFTVNCTASTTTPEAVPLRDRTGRVLFGNETLEFALPACATPPTTTSTTTETTTTTVPTTTSSTLPVPTIVTTTTTIPRSQGE